MTNITKAVTFPAGLDTFYQFSGGYNGRIHGDVSIEDIYRAIIAHSPTVKIENLNVAVIDYDAAVYFVALDYADLALQYHLTSPAIKDSLVEIYPHGASQSTRGWATETHPCHTFADDFVEVTVEKTAPGSNRIAPTVTIDIEYECIMVEGPTGHRAKFVLSHRAIRNLLESIC